MSANSLSMPFSLKRWPRGLLIVGAHLLALPLAAFSLRIAAGLGLATSFMQFVLIEGVVSAIISRQLGLPRWWQLINLVFLPALWLSLQAEIEPIWYLAGLLVLLLTSYGALTSRVPLYLSSDQAVREVAGRIPNNRPVRVIDLGCGLGGMLAGLARARPGIELHGVDAAPLPWLFSRLRLGGLARVRLGSLWSEDLSDYDLVYAYLSPEPMPDLWDKVKREMRPGSLFVSNTFAVPDVPPDEIIELRDLSRARLLLWQIR